jgi:hypothetical protein
MDEPTDHRAEVEVSTHAFFGRYKNCCSLAIRLLTVKPVP